jgi:hypothetical protein
MTRDEAIAEAERKQRSHPEVTWLAAQRDGEWTVARIDVASHAVKPIGTATKPPPVTPYEDRRSPIERAGNLWGGG